MTEPNINVTIHCISTIPSSWLYTVLWLKRIYLKTNWRGFEPYMYRHTDCYSTLYLFHGYGQVASSSIGDLGSNQVCCRTQVCVVQLVSNTGGSEVDTRCPRQQNNNMPSELGHKAWNGYFERLRITVPTWPVVGQPLPRRRVHHVNGEEWNTRFGKTLFVEYQCPAQWVRFV